MIYLYIKTKIRTYGDKVYTNFRRLNVPEDDIEDKFFTVISIDSLLVHENKCYMQVYLDSCAYKITDKQVTDFLDNNLEILCTALYADDGLFSFDEDSADVTFFCNEMGILSVNLNNIILDKK